MKARPDNGCKLWKRTRIWRRYDVHRRLHEKVSRGEALDAQDRIDLILSPLMRQRRALDDVLPDAAQLAQALPAGQLKPTMAALVGLAYHYIDERRGRFATTIFAVKAALFDITSHLSRGYGTVQGR